MFLYINGSGHAVAANAVNTFVYADEDKSHHHLGHVPHPKNISVSYGTVLANLLKMTYVSGANPKHTNLDIIQSTSDWISSIADHTDYEDMLIVIQWANHDHFNEIVAFHNELMDVNIKHIFFNSSGAFDIPEDERYDFGECFISPYLADGSYDGWLQAQGYAPVITSNVYYGQGAHSAWAKRLAKHIVESEML